MYCLCKVPGCVHARIQYYSAGKRLFFCFLSFSFFFFFVSAWLNYMFKVHRHGYRSDEEVDSSIRWCKLGHVSDRVSSKRLKLQLICTFTSTTPCSYSLWLTGVYGTGGKKVRRRMEICAQKKKTRTIPTRRKYAIHSGVCTRCGIAARVWTRKQKAQLKLPCLLLAPCARR